MTATSPHPKRADHRVRMRRSGVATLWLILFIPVFLIALCVVIDVGTIWMARAELEDGLEAAAIAGVVVWEDANDPRIVPPPPGQQAAEADARAAAIAMAAANSVRGEPIVIVDGDIALGEIRYAPAYEFAVINPVGVGNDSAIRIIADATVASRAIPGVNYTVQAGVIAVARGGDFYLLPSP
ncbi:MAG: TadE/TadG family type IV pilus assembly protein [Planctomycetota bacterium]